MIRNGAATITILALLLGGCQKSGDNNQNNNANQNNQADAGMPDASSNNNFVGCSRAGEVSSGTVTEGVTFTSSADGLTLFGTLYLPSGEQPWASVVLLHQYCSSRTEYTGASSTLALDLAQRGFAVLGYDARGFGQSTDSGQLDYCGQANAALFAPMTDDLVSAIDYLETRTAPHTDCLGVVGASMGSSVALIVGGNDPRVDAVVMLSPGLGYLGLLTSPAVPQYEPRPWFMLAATGDAASANDLASLAAIGNNELTLTIGGNWHGVQIIAADAGAHADVLDFLGEQL